MPRALTKAEAQYFLTKKIANGVPVRFMHQGQAMNIVTGELDPKGINVMHQTVYWCFSKETAAEIAKVTGTKAVY